MRIKNLFLVILVSGVINSCTKSKDIDETNNNNNNGNVTPAKTAVHTYEVINLVVRGNIAARYTASFGSAQAELIKTSDSTLTFFVPEVPAGEAVLRFELATIRFNVTPTAEVNPTELVNNVFTKIATMTDSLHASTSEELSDVSKLNEDKEEVRTLFNNLSPAQKRQAALFYEANKEVFKSFSENTFANINGPTVYRTQRECDRSNFTTFYSCTAENLGNAAINLRRASVEFLQYLLLAGASAYLAPASFGLSTFGTALALGAAGYLLITEVRPAALRMKFSTLAFLNANWIFGKSLFQATVEVFGDQTNTLLNLKPTFRSINSDDGNVNPGSAFFISAMTSLSESWNRLTAIFGTFPTYKNTEVATTLVTVNITINNISNSNVQFLGNTDQQVKFKTLSGNEETFTYTLKVTKEGFTEQKTMNGKVTATTDSTAIYANSALGLYTVTGYVGNGPNSTLTCELATNGTAVYRLYNDPAWPNGQIFPESWKVTRVNNKYYILTTFTNPDYIQSEAGPMTYPVTTFLYRNVYVK